MKLTTRQGVLQDLGRKGFAGRDLLRVPQGIRLGRVLFGAASGKTEENAEDQEIWMRMISIVHL